MVKTFGSVGLSFWLAVSPLWAHGQQATAAAVPFESQASRLSQSRVETRTSFHPEYIEVTARDQNNREQKLQIVKWPEEEIRKFSPKNLSRDFAAKLKDVRAWDNLKATTKRFPMEATMFFMAIGAVTAFQISTEYSANPMRMAQHIEHSISPLGMFSFYMFMATNGVTGAALQTWIKNPRFHHFIPYLGMSAGYFVQSTISTFAADPNVKACVKQQLGQDISKIQGISEDPCEAAFSSYALKGKFYELMPGLVSMIGSTFLAWGAERLLVKAVLKITGVDIAFMLMPGGVGVSAVRVAFVNAIRMGLFYYIDVVFLNHAVTFSFKNIFDGRYLAKLDREIVSRLQKKKETEWADQLTPMLCEMRGGKSQDCRRDLAETLKEAHEQLSNWRMLNLTRVYEAHMGWQDMLSQINSHYDATYSFYGDLVEEVRNSKYRFSEPFRLERQDPLFGVTAKDMPEDKAYMYYYKPNFTDYQATETAREVGEEIKEQLRQQTYYAQGFLPNEVHVLEEIANKLVSSDLNTQGQGIQLLNRSFHRGHTTMGLTQLFSEELRRISGKLGESPQAFMNPGQGFLARYERWSDNVDSLKKTKFPRAAGMFVTAKPTEYMTVQSICGPDPEKNEKVTQIAFGGAGTFVPPRLTPQTPFVCDGIGDYREQSSQMMFQMALEGPQGTHNGVLQYLMKEIKPSILGTEQDSGFVPWWEKQVEPQVHARYKEFGREYEKIVISLIQQLHSTQDSSWNAGPAANGIVESIRQQMRLNLMVLGEVLKDLHQIQKKQALPRAFVNSRAEPVPAKLATNAKFAKTAPRSSLLGALREGGTPAGSAVLTPTQTSILDFNRLAPLLFAENQSPQLGAAQTFPLQIQKEVEFEFETLMWMLRRIKVKNIDGFERISSDLENADLDAQVQKITAKLEIFGNLLGAGDQEQGTLVTLPTKEVRDVVVNALEDLAALAQEIQMYGSMSNAVSWEKIRRLENSQQQQEFANSIQQKVQQMGNSMTRMGGAR